MLILHGAVARDTFLLWGEASLEADASPRHEAKPNQKNAPRPEKRPPLLCYDAGADRLDESFQATGLEFLRTPPESEKLAEAVLWAPSQKKQPLPSNPLLGEPSPSRAKVVLAPWKITAVWVNSREVIELLCRVMERRILAPGVIPGTDLTYWASALRWGAALVAREQFLPDLLPQEKTYRAAWTGAFLGNDGEELSALAAQMPGSARAVTLHHRTPPDRPALEVLTSFLEQTVDALVRWTRLGESTASTPIVSKRGSIGRKPPTKRRTAQAAAHYASIHDHWMAALQTSDGLMEAKNAELAALRKQVVQWRQPLPNVRDAPFRLCFRLEEPEESFDVESSESETPQPEAMWNVSYLLQSVADPSLLISAKHAWSGKGRQAKLLRHNGFDARQMLLSSLGQASSLCPAIERSLKSSAPPGVALATEEAFEFLTNYSLAIRRAGFGVMLPAWWTGKATKQRITARAWAKSPAMQGGGGLGLEDIVEFRWQVAVGDELVSRDELRRLARIKAPLVQFRGRWVQLSAEEIEAALQLMKKKTAEKTTLRDLVKMEIGAVQASHEGGVEIECSGVDADQWIGEFLSRLRHHDQIELLPAPQGFQGQLRPYQERGYSWLAFLELYGLGACLADDMGLGKTVQTLALIARLWNANGSESGKENSTKTRSKKTRPTLLVCPTSVLGNWRKEAERFTPQLPVMVHHGADRKKGVAFKKEAAGQALVVTSYNLLHRDLPTLEKTPWKGVVLDEAQNIKNPETKQSKAARSLKTDFRIALTGTPVENNVGDLWAISEFLNPGYLGTQAAFKRRFFVPIQAEQDQQAAERLKRLTGPFVLRRLKTDKSIIADLPEKLENNVYCTLTKEQASLYEAVVEQTTGDLPGSEGIERRGLVLAALSKLKQVCNHPAQFLGDNSQVAERSGKLIRLTEMVQEVLDAGERALIFSQFSEMGAILQRWLTENFGCETLFLHGGVTKKRRDTMIERFQDESQGPPLFVLSLKAGGTGLNLTRANHVFHFDRWWNPAVENQATDRAFRIGQKKNVQVHKFVCLGTVEERIDDMIRRKQQVADNVVGTGEKWITELSNDELHDMFRLRDEALT